MHEISGTAAEAPDPITRSWSGSMGEILELCVGRGLENGSGREGGGMRGERGGEIDLSES